MLQAKSQEAALKAQLASAWQFLQKNSITHFAGQQPLLDLPWYLMIGPPHAGKTQLIHNSEFKFIAAPQLNIEPQDESAEDHRLNVWFTQTMTFFDVPGHFLQRDENTDNWSSFLELLRPYLRRKPLNGIILLLDLAELSLLSKSEQKHYIQGLQSTLSTLSQTLPSSCPLYLFLSKVDRVQGFNEFFADLGREERAQICGLNLAQAPNANMSSLPRLFKSQFEALLKRLQARVIWRLQHERNANKRALIAQFPIQLEMLQAPLSNLLYQLADNLALNAKLPLQGIYFVSSVQNGLPIDCLRKTLSQDLMSSSNIAALPNTRTAQSYFSRQLFANIVANTAVLSSFNKRFNKYDKWRWSAYIFSLTLLACSGLWMANNFNQHAAKLNAAQSALAQYNLLEQQLSPQNPDLGQTLPALAALREASGLIAQTPNTWFSTRARELTPLAKEAYHAGLKTYFLPNLSTMLEHALSNSSDPDFIYGALKVYMMLGDPSHLQQAFIQQWFAQYWQQLFASNPALQQQLNAHLASLFAGTISPIALNQTILDKARTLLAQTPAPQLAYIMVKAQAADEIVDPLKATPAQMAALKQVFSNLSPGMEHLYSRQMFSEVYLNRTLAASAILLKGDWVLGATPRNRLSTTAMADLVKQVRILYLQDYAKQWQAWLNNIQLIPWQNASQMKTSLNALTGHQSPFVLLIKVLSDNTELQTLTSGQDNFSAEDRQLINDNLSRAFLDLNTFNENATQPATSALNAALVALKNLRTYLAPLLEDKAPGESILLLTQARFDSQKRNSDAISALNQFATKAPAPLRNWLMTMAAESWQLLLTQTTQYINAAWQHEVVSFYQQKIAQHYPVQKTASTDISLADFKHFFGKKGILLSFFEHYLAPFIDTSRAQWQWLSVEGKTLNVAADLLPQLERAAIIGNMFFDAEGELNVAFSLQAVSFEPGISGFAFKLGEQGFVDKMNQQSSHAMIWPGTGKDADITLTFTDSTNQIHTATRKGPWALFHLLDKSNLQQLNDTQHYKLLFDLNGNSARYGLTAKTPINPFISDIVEQFQCTTSLN